jgi:hypothetical protein
LFAPLQGLFYTGLFIAGLTSSFGVLTGAPRVMQGLGEDVKVPGIEQFAVTFGSKEEPLRGLFASAIITGCMWMPLCLGRWPLGGRNRKSISAQRIPMLL